MSRPLQADEAIDLLIKDPSKYQSPQALRELARQVSVESPGQVTVLYSGRVADRVSAWNIVKAMEEAGEDVRLIDRTEINSFLNSREFTRAAAVAHGVTVDDMRRGDPIAKAANDWLYHPTEGPWADASARFADATRGEVKVIASGAAPDRVFGQTELPRILANPDVTTVEGIPRQTLAARQATHGTQAAFEMIVARSHENVGVIRSAVNAQGMPLRGDTGQLQLDNREYFRGTEIEARTPAFAESARPMADLMGPPNAHALAGHQHLDELAQAASHAQRPGSSGLNPRLQGLNLGLAAEAAVTAYEWNETRQRAQVFANTLHNDSAARDAYVRQGAQTGGALVGTAVGAGTAVAVGAGTGGTAVLVTGSAYLFGEAAEHGMELWQKRQIYNIQSEGVDWAFNGRQWLRKDLRADLIDDGQDVTRQQDFAAPPDKARELSAAASAKAVEQALGSVPQPRNPFVLPANDSDAHSLRTRDWNYQPDTGQWLREVVTDLDHREMPSEFRTIEADAERAAQLSAQAVQIIDGNLRAGPAEIAAQYQRGHKTYGYEQTPAGAMPDAIAPALNPDLRQASDGKHYIRDAQGDWSHEGKAADPHRALELELTRERLLPALEAHRQQLAQMPTWQPPTPEAQDRAALREAYLNRGIDRETSPENFEASYLAIQRTRADSGVSAANTALVLGQGANGQFTPDSPIHHVHFAVDGTVQIAATTSSEDIARALADVRARALNADAPRETPPEHGLKAPTPEQRDAREQALREANRQGLSHDDAQQAMQAAAIGASTRDVASAGALDPDALRPGDRGDSVELLQYRLDRQGYRGPEGTPIPQTGQYGPETEHAVRQFQTMHGLPASGVADRDTRDAVDHALAAQRERERGELDREPGDTSRSAPVLDAAARTVDMSASAGRSRDDAPEREPETLTRAEVRPAALAETSFDPAIAYRVATRDERDDERQPSTDPNSRQAAVDEHAQQTPALVNQPGHPAHAMYAQALRQIERGDLMPAGTMTQEEKSRLAAGVVAQFLAEDKFATRIDGLYASNHNAAGPGMPTSLIPVQGDPTTDYCRRASINVEQALHTSLAQSSTIAQTATQAREQELTRQQELAQQQDQNGTKGPAMRIGPRTLQQGPQGPQADGGGGDGGGG